MLLCHGISQARILEWVTISFSRGSSWPKDRTWVFSIACRLFTAEPPWKPLRIQPVVQLVMSNSLQSHGLKHNRFPCPSLCPTVCSNSCSLNWWCHSTISSSIMPFSSSPSIFPNIRVFSNELALHIRWPKYWSFSISPSNEYSELISFRIDWLDFLAVQGTLKSLLQHHSSKASILRCSALRSNSYSLLKLMSIESVVLSNYLILCWPLFLLPSIFSSNSILSNELALHIRWPKYWSFSMSPSNEYSDLISFRIDI